jgi:hypothetical protein
MSVLELKSVHETLGFSEHSFGVEETLPVVTAEVTAH